MKLIQTGDGSFTLSVDEAGTEIYHSRHGALAEALHVFIGAGLEAFSTDTDSASEVPIRVLEVGAGTCLNMALTLQWARRAGRAVSYLGIDPYMPDRTVLDAIDYPSLLGLEASTYLELTEAKEFPYVEGASTYHLSTTPLMETRLPSAGADVIYHDAFSPRFQPDLWTAEVFDYLYQSLAPGGYLVTYCAQGAVKRTLKSVGFVVEALPGPKGKREMTRALKHVKASTLPLNEG